MVLTLIQSRSITLASKLRFPAIKFRYGAGRDHKAASTTSPMSSQSNKQGEGGVIYDFQLPQRFRKRPIDQFEIDYINRGGPA